jgi:hypothetical protein
MAFTKNVADRQSFGGPGFAQWLDRLMLIATGVLEAVVAVVQFGDGQFLRTTTAHQ